MATDLELDRLAAALAILRPTWHPAATRSWLATEPARTLRARPLPDLAVVMVACALDDANRTPAAVLRPGPWWSVVERVNDRRGSYVPGPDGAPCTRPGHEHERADACRSCAGERLAGTDPGRPARPIPAPAGWRPTREDPA